jgi:hypothetical protein
MTAAVFWTAVKETHCTSYINFGLQMALAISLQPLAVETRLDPKPVHMGFVVNKMALRRGFLRVIRFSSVSIIPPTQILVFKLLLSGGKADET